MVQPIVYDNDALGVIELASFTAWTDIQCELLSQLAGNLGVIIQKIWHQKRTDQLLITSQQLALEAQLRAEELSHANEELEGQSRELQLLNEAIREQAEELQMSNQALEEQSEFLEIQMQEVARKSADLEQMSRYKSQFLANMSHELRTPLNSLLILAQSLEENREENLTEKQIEAARVIHASGRELLSLINDLLDLSKIEAGQLSLQWESVTLQHTLDYVRKQFEPVARQKALAFELVVEDETPEIIVTDEQRLIQILRNLLANAFKFTSRGKVQLRVQRDRSWSVDRGSEPCDMITFTISDTGIGIPQDRLILIFEAFQQGDGSTSRRYGGTGLGLTISKELTERLGGHISVQSRVDEGSQFILRLPVSQGAAHQPRREPPPGDALPATRSGLASTNVSERRLLIIDDHEDFAAMVKAHAEASGLTCDIAYNASDGLRLAIASQPSGIILDLGLPDIDGETLFDTLRMTAATSHIPVHVVSARDSGAALVKKGAVGFLAKPVSTDDLSHMLQTLEKPSGQHAYDLLIIGDEAFLLQTVQALSEIENVNIATASSGEEGLALLQARQFDCLILDLRLADLPDISLLHFIDQTPSVTSPQIILCTDRELAADEQRTLQRFSRIFVQKGEYATHRLLDEVRLFIHQLDHGQPPAQRSAVHRLDRKDLALQGKKVLLVDDDVRSIYALAHELDARKLDIVMADNGQFAIEKLEQEPDIDLIVMDIMMPGMDGYEAMRRIRRIEHYANIPIIALTAKAMPEDRSKCIDAGANDYLTKPVNVEHLCSMMKIWLDRGR